MKSFLPLTLAMLIGFSLLHAETLDNESLLEDQQLFDGVLRRLPESLEEVYKRYGRW
jgi:hypothetical protein